MNPPNEPEVIIPPLKGTRVRAPRDFARMARLEATILGCFEQAGYDRVATPILEPVELHERKSGAGIVAKLFTIEGSVAPRVCLRPELTAGIVRAYTMIEPAPALPWRVSHAGAAFRHENPTRPDRLREFHQVGLERLGDCGPFADAEVIWLAVWALQQVGIEAPTVRIGHVGLILEILTRSGLPASVQTALVEMLSEAAAEGADAGSIESGLDHFEAWLRHAAEADPAAMLDDASAAEGIDRLFRTLMPVVNGRRSSGEIVARLRRKWELGHGLLDKLAGVRSQIRSLTELRGTPSMVLARLARDFEAWAPESVASLRSLFESLDHHGVATDTILLDLGLGRGIGFYSQMIFDLTTRVDGVEVELGGGGRYDGLARVLGSNRDDRGVGFAFGLERIDEVLRAQAEDPARRIAGHPRSILVIPASTASIPAAVRMAAGVRASGGRAILESGWRAHDMDARARALLARWSAIVQRSTTGDIRVTLHDHASTTAVDVSAADAEKIIVASLQETGP